VSLIGYEEEVFDSKQLISENVSLVLQVFEFTGDNKESVVDSDEEDAEEHGVVDRDDADRELFESSLISSPFIFLRFGVKSLSNTSAPLKM